MQPTNAAWPQLHVRVSLRGALGDVSLLRSFAADLPFVRPQPDTGLRSQPLKCERCREHEAEVHHTNLVRTAERNEAQTQHLCRVCANVDPTVWQAALEQMLKSEQELTPEQRSSLEGFADMLRQLRLDAGSKDAGSQG